MSAPSRLEVMEGEVDAGTGTDNNTNRKHVVLQLEAESLSDTQRLVMLLRASILVGIAALIFQTVYKVCLQSQLLSLRSF